MLREIDLANYNQGHKFQKINAESWCVSELYCSYLKKYETGKVSKCIVEVSDNWGIDENKFVNYSNDVRRVRLNFNFDKYFKLDKFSKKKMQLETLHEGMLLIAGKEGWEKKPLIESYKNCIKNNLEYQFLVKDQLKTSPDKKYKVGFWCNWDLDKFEVFWVLFDKKGNEIRRQLFIEKEPYKGVLIYYISWKWADNNTILVEDKYKYGDNEKWEITIY